MTWELAVQLLVAIVGILAVGTVVFQINKKSKNSKMTQSIKGNHNIQAGRDIKIEKGDTNDYTPKN